MKTRFSFWFIAVLLLVGCSSMTKKMDGMMEANDILRLMVCEKMATDSQYDALMVNFEKIFEKKVEPFTGFIYLLNSNCSFCVGQFLGFLSFLEKKNVDLPIVVIVEEGVVFLRDFI